jgi:hypothetical protein
VTNYLYVYSKKESLFCTGFKTELISFAGIVAKSWQNTANLRKQNNFFSLLRSKHEGEDPKDDDVDDKV